MLKAVRFRNFKALRDTVLPLSQFTLIVGPNGSGKTTAFQALKLFANPSQQQFASIVSAGLPPEELQKVKIALEWSQPNEGVITLAGWRPNGSYYGPTHEFHGGLTPERYQELTTKLAALRVYSLDAMAIAAPVQVQPQLELGSNGSNLAGVLDGLKDQEPERFEAWNHQLKKWVPEFDKILLDTPSPCHKSLLLRTVDGRHRIKAADLSQGTLLVIAILTIAYLPDSPPMVCLEEPDRGIHPRLLRDLRDALYRLSYPEQDGEQRQPVQVLTTTHSPYLLDLYRDHTEEVVIAQRVGSEVQFERLSELSDLDEILRDSHLGDLWYSGILGGVPSEP